VIWFLKLVILLDGKNLARKALVSSSHVLINPEGKECSHAHALSLSEKGNNHSQMASVETLLCFNVPHTSKKTERCMFGSSKVVPPNWDHYTMEMRVGLSSKLFVLTLGWAILEAMPWTLGVTKSVSILFWSPPPLAMFGEVFLASHLCSLSVCFFLLKWKILSISGLGPYRNGLRVNGKDSCMHSHQHYQRNQTRNRKKNKIKHLPNFVRLT